MTTKGDIAERIRLMAKLNDKRRKQGADILLSVVLEIEEKEGNVS